MARGFDPSRVTIERIYNEDGDNGKIFNNLIRVVFKGKYGKVFQEKDDQTKLKVR